MKRINTVWLALALFVSLTGATVQAHAAQQAGTSSRPSTHDAQPPSSHTDHEQKATKTIRIPYRLTYTLTMMDGARQIGSQKYEVVQDVNSPPMQINLDSVVPVHRGSPTSPQYDREHIGIKIWGQLHQFTNGIELTTNIFQTGFVQETGSKREGNSAPPVTRVSTLSASVLLDPDKPLTIGRFDMPGSTRVLMIQVEMHKLQ